jgi:hypothetical protein
MTDILQNPHRPQMTATPILFYVKNPRTGTIFALIVFLENESDIEKGESKKTEGTSAFHEGSRFNARGKRSIRVP